MASGLEAPASPLLRTGLLARRNEGATADVPNPNICALTFLICPHVRQRREKNKGERGQKARKMAASSAARGCKGVLGMAPPLRKLSFVS
jgi:hypothetical protein